MYSGALTTKRKADLQEIANALKIPSDGVRETLASRIKEHLDQNQAILEEDSRFVGLYGKKRRGSVQPQELIEEAPAPKVTRGSSSRRTTTTATLSHGGHVTQSLDTILDEESSPPSSSSPTKRSPKKLASMMNTTPVTDLRAVSVMLKKNTRSVDVSPVSANANAKRIQEDSEEPESPTLVRSEYKRREEEREGEKVALPMLPHAGPQEVVKYTTEQALSGGAEMIHGTRRFLSDSRNIWSTTAVAELAYILYTIIPWKYYNVTDTHQIPYPPIAAFQAGLIWTVILHWILPTIIVPTLAARFISFSPAAAYNSPLFSASRSSSTRASSPSLSQSLTTTQSTPTPSALPPPSSSSRSNLNPSSAYKAIDPLTASIVRLFVHMMYPYPALGLSTPGVDVLGKEWRVWSAALGVTFAFAEAVGMGAAAAASNANQARRLDGGAAASEKMALEGCAALE